MINKNLFITARIDSNVDFSYLDDFRHADVMQLVQDLVNDVDSGRDAYGNLEDWEIPTLLHEVYSILSYLEYSPDFIDHIINSLNAHMLNVNVTFNALNIQYMTPISFVSDDVRFTSKLSYYKGRFIDFSLLHDHIDDYTATNFKLGMSCVASHNDNTYTGILRSIRSNGMCIIQDDVTGRLLQIDMGDVRVWHKDALTDNVASLIDYTISLDPVTSDNPTAWHSNFGRVEILGYTKDEYGQEVVMIQPMDLDNFMVANKVKFSVKDDEIGSSRRIRDLRSVFCYPCELVTMDQLGKYADKIKAVMSGKVKLPEYHAFSSQEFTSRAAIRDRQSKIISGFEKTEMTTPVTSGLDENVYVIADLPRSPIMGCKTRMYQPIISKMIRDSIIANTDANGKVDFSRVKFPNLKSASIDVIPTSDIVTVNGLTKYTANITDTYEAFKVKTVVHGKSVWQTQYQMPMVLVMGVDTGRLFVTPAWWLYKVAVPDELSVVVPKYKQTRDIPRNFKIDNIDKYFEKIKDMPIKLNLSYTVVDGKVVYNEPRHKRYFDLITTRRDLAYKYTDPRTQKHVKAPETFVYDPNIDVEYAPLGDAITGSQVMRASRDYTKQERSKKVIEDITEEIKALGIDSVKCTIQNDTASILVNKQGMEFTINFKKVNKKFVNDTQKKMSKKATDLFSRLVSAMHNKTLETVK